MTQPAADSTVLVTGAGGFIGTALIRRFLSAGWRAIGCGRRRPEGFPQTAQWRAYDLASTARLNGLFEGVDVLIHAAFVKQNLDCNVAGSTRLLEEARSRGVTQTVFISSLAAHAGALSQYGKQKYALQQLFERCGALVVRPGLVLGSGGTFEATRAYLQKHRFIPLIDGGSQPLQTVYVDDLSAAMYAAIARRTSGTFTIAEREPVSYREFYQTLAARLGINVWFVPIPFWAADLAIRTAAMFRVALPIDRDNLLGLRAMQLDEGPRLEPPDRPVGDFRRNIELTVARCSREV